MEDEQTRLTISLERERNISFDECAQNLVDREKESLNLTREVKNEPLAMVNISNLALDVMYHHRDDGHGMTHADSNESLQWSQKGIEQSELDILSPGHTNHNIEYQAGLNEVTLCLPKKRDESMKYKSTCIICGPTLEIPITEYTKLTTCQDIQSEICQLLKILSPLQESDTCCKRCLDLMKTFIRLKNNFLSVKQKIIALHIDAQSKCSDLCSKGQSESEDDAATNSITRDCNINSREQREEMIIKSENVDIDYNKTISSTSEKNTNRRNNLPTKKFKCGQCEKTYSNKLYFVEHERTHTGEKPFKCQYCPKRFHRRMSCVGHEKREHIEKPYHCKICFRGFRVSEECEVHENTHTAPRPFSCQYCTRTFEKQDESWFRHERTHTGERPYKCQHCDKTFSVKAALRKHEKLRHPGLKLTKEDCYQSKKVENKKLHNCNLCEEIFDNKNDLLEHEKVHEFKCVHCGKSCWGVKALKNHERSHTREKPFKCHFCELSFHYEGPLEEHMKTHTDERPYLCQYCTKSFKQRATLFVHERAQHTGVKPHKCQHCDECFPTRRLCVEHERYHTGEKPFKCDFCEKSFIRKSNWKSHVNIHSGVKSEVCSYCGKQFRTKRNLVNHERIHTGERPYNCQYCEKAFRKKYHCTVHMKKLHWREINEKMTIL